MPHASGIGAVVQGDSGFADMTGLAQMVMQMKQMQKTNAMQSLQMMNEMAKQGMPVDPAAYEKAVKSFEKAYGVKFGDAAQQGGAGTAQNPNVMGGAPQEIPQPVTPAQGKAIQAVGQAGTQLSGAQSATPVSASSAKAYPAGGMQPPMQGGNIYENYLNQVKRVAQAKSLSEQRNAELNAKLDEMKTAALGGDTNARDQLQAMGVIAFDKDFERLQSLKKDSPEEYAKEMGAAHDRALGLESPQQKEQRRSQFVTSLVATGRYTAEQANAEFEKPGSSGVKKSIKELSEEADWYDKLATNFGDEAAKKIAPQLATGASLSEVLPAVGEYQSKFAQQLAASKAEHAEEINVRREGLGIEREKLQFEKEMGAERLQNLSDKVQLEMAKAENQAFSANMSDMISAVKGGIAVPQEVMDRYVGELARRAGLTKLESRSVLNRWTFGLLGQGDKWAPDTEKGLGVLDELVPKEAAPSTRGGMNEAESESEKVRIGEKRRKAGMLSPNSPLLNQSGDAALSQFMRTLGTGKPRIIGER